MSHLDAAAATQPDELIAFGSRKDTPHWLSEAALVLRSRDPVKAANEAEVLAELLRKRANRILSESMRDLGMAAS